MQQTLKHRIIKVDGMTKGGCEEIINKSIAELPGVTSVKANSASGNLEVSYDLMKVKLLDIESKVVQSGYKLPDSMLERSNRSRYHFFEQNEYDNLKNPGSMCGGCRKCDG